MLPGEWVLPKHIPVWGSEVGGEHVQWNYMDNRNKTQANKKWPWESSDREREEKQNYFPSFIVMESAEEIPLSKLSPFKIEKIFSKRLKPKNSLKKTLKWNTTNRNCTKNQADEILKWKHFDDMKIKTYPHNSQNTCKGVVKSH